LFHYSTLLDLPAGDLAALTGITPVSGPPAPRPDVAGMAELVWELRRLTAEQVEHVYAVARTMAPPQVT
jgi:hypothetical protein